ncbi:Cytochrome b5 reductase 4 [Nibea albiflora]|uniref:Cytochrome b5 reductase 4 n=1 Tax=Nibea albiflora TaxID=240163 RepID=A0ACB7F7C8_NIBAL|nr:Cytochrome b5 reductase 4 [Nibea albiflora]
MSDENQRDPEEDDDDDSESSSSEGRAASLITLFNSLISGFLRSWGCLRSGHNMLNIPTQSFPAPGSQQRVAPSGQSGRNKVALKPGHSLMDWIRFSKSGKDLTGFRGRLIEVTQEELQKHNTRDDCWTCIRGMVYNVTPYMDYHPGGEDELMKAAGVDGTDLFDQVHRWVNYESMLKECLVGRMATAIKGLADEVEGNVSVHTAFSVGKIQVTIRKQAKGKWTSLGQPLEFHNTFLRKKDRAPYYRDCVLVSKTEVNYNTYVYRLQLPRGSVRHVPVGKHVYLKALIQDTEVVRPYTPVDPDLAAASSHSSQDSDLYLMIKVYPDGVFTPHLNSLHIGDHLSVSGPEGPFSLRPLRDVTHLYLLAAGTGFTPMARLIPVVLQDISTIRKTKLLFLNRQETDILWRGELDDLAANDERFEVEYVLSEPGESWTGRKGRVDEGMLKDFLCRPDGSKCYVCVCGPTAFTELTIGMAQPCEKRHRLIGYMDTELNNRVRPPHSSGLDSCSLFQCYVSKEGQLSSRALWTTGRGASGGCHRTPSSSLEGEDGMLLQELAVANRTEKEGILLAHFSIPNCVNSDQSSSVGEDGRLLGEPELPVTLEGRDQSAVNHNDHNDFHATRKSAAL